MSEFAGRQVLVTGAGGFIGGHLVDRLVRDGAEVRAFVKYNSRGHRGTLDCLPEEVASEIDVVAGDIRDVESIADAVRTRAVVFHLAAQIAIPYSFLNPRDYFETNVLGTLNVARAALAHGVERVVHTSTSEVYGSARAVPITEDHPLEPQSPYAASKVGADKAMDSFHRSFGLPVTVLRPFNTFGPYQSARAIIPTIISQAIAGHGLRLGSLSPRRDFTFVSDTASGFVKAATVNAAVGETVQLGTGREVSVADLVDMVGSLLGRSLEIEHDPSRLRPAASEVDRLVSQPRRARELLGWSPRVALEEGLKQTIAWIEQNPRGFRVASYAV